MNLNNTISILDVTLRDGGHVNNFAFGQSAISTIINCLVQARIDVIELGFLKNVAYSPDKTLFSSVAQAEALLNGMPREQSYSLMIRPDWYDINQLEPRSGRIGKIRWAFHARDLELTIHQAKLAKNLGYEIYFNPVNVFSYSDERLRYVLNALNEVEPSNVAIVDTHGSMVEHDLLRYYYVFDQYLNPGIGISVHLHENLSLSFSLAQKFISLVQGKRQASIDASILGMGRIPGNLCTELIAQYLNFHHGGEYEISAIHEAIANPVSIIKKKLPWGYAPLYAESAFRKMHRSYAEYLMDSTDLSVKESSVVLSWIESSEDREEFNLKLVEDLVTRFRLTRTGR